MVAGTWLCAFGALIQTWRGMWGEFGLDTSIGSCSIVPDSDSKPFAMNIYKKLINVFNFSKHKSDSSPKDIFFVGAFVVPCLAIIVCYARIFYIVRKTAMRSHEPMLRQKFNTSSMITSVPTITNCLLPKNNNVAVAHRLSKDNGRHSPRDRPSNQSRRTYDTDGISGSSEHSTSTVTCQTLPLAQFEPKVFLKFIDSSVDSESPPNFNAVNDKYLVDKIQNNEKPIQRKLSSVSTSKTVEFKDGLSGGLGEDAVGDGELSVSLNLSQYSSAMNRSSKGKKQNRKDGDSAVEESTSSSENNQV